MNSMWRVRELLTPSALALLVGTLLMVIGIAPFVQSQPLDAGSWGTLVHFLAAFLIVTGGQMILWGLGIRTELLGTSAGVDEDEAVHTKRGSCDELETTVNKILEQLRDRIHAAAHTSELLTPDREVLSTLVTEGQARISRAETRPLQALLELCGELENAGYKLYADYATDQRMPGSPQATIRRLAQQGMVTRHIAEALDALWSLRDAIVHSEKMELDLHTIRETIDIGNRLLILLSARSVEA